MESNAPVTVRKVANGFIIEPHIGPEGSPRAMDMNDINVYETFEALVKGLEQHFPKTDPRPK